MREEFRKATPDADGRHAEIMALLLRPSQPSTIPVTSPPTSQLSTITAPSSTLPTVVTPIPPPGFSTPLPSHPPPPLYSQPPPLFFSSSMVFDEFGVRGSIIDNWGDCFFFGMLAALCREHMEGHPSGIHQ